MSSSSSSSSSKSLTEVISAVIHRVKLSLAELADRNGSTAHAIKKHCNIINNALSPKHFKLLSVATSTCFGRKPVLSITSSPVSLFSSSTLTLADPLTII